MRYFLDMCIVLYYIGEGDIPNLNKKAIAFISNKKENKFLLCYYIKDVDIPKWLKRQKIILSEVIKKINDSSYELFSSKDAKYLTKRDKNKLAKVSSLFKNLQDKKEFLDAFEKATSNLEINISGFIKNYIDEFVIPTKEIDSELTSYLMNFINLGSSNKNISDVNTIASAIQAHSQKELTIITADRNDWKTDLLEEIAVHPKLNKKYPKIPEMRYLQKVIV